MLILLTRLKWFMHECVLSQTPRYAADIFPPNDYAGNEIIKLNCQCKLN